MKAGRRGGALSRSGASGLRGSTRTTGGSVWSPFRSAPKTGQNPTRSRAEAAWGYGKMGRFLACPTPGEAPWVGRPKNRPLAGRSHAPSARVFPGFSKNPRSDRGGQDHGVFTPYKPRLFSPLVRPQNPAGFLAGENFPRSTINRVRGSPCAGHRNTDGFSDHSTGAVCIFRRCAPQTPRFRRARRAEIEAPGEGEQKSQFGDDSRRTTAAVGGQQKGYFEPVGRVSVGRSSFRALSHRSCPLPPPAPRQDAGRALSRAAEAGGEGRPAKSGFH